MAWYSKYLSTKQTPQSEPIPGRNQVANSAGGFTFALDDWGRLDRFLILGCEGSTYYASERELSIENAQAVLRCIEADGPRAVARIVEISVAGRAPKQNPAIFALALATAAGSEAGRAAALAALPKVCRTGTHLFQFAKEVNELRGWGRGLRRAVADWYTEKPSDKLAYQLVKYQQREGWSHRDLLRLSHPKAADPSRNALFHYVVKGATAPELQSPLVEAFEKAKRSTDKKEVAGLIREFDLPRECVPTALLNEAEVWDALLDRMPMTAMIRNLAMMTRVGLLTPMSSSVRKVVTELGDVSRLRAARIHPIAVLSALKTYGQGRGERGKSTWTPIQKIVDALDKAFYLSFGNVEPTGKRWLLACDVSGSMECGTIAGVPGLTPRIATAALALVTANVEHDCEIVGFTAGSRPSMHAGYGTALTPLKISPRRRLDDVCKYMAGLTMGGTDCALPMIHATEKKLPVDAFVVLTDNETWAGSIHPTQALAEYRQKMGVAAKMAVVGMTATEFTIADPNDAGSLDLVGFDAATPQAMAEFAKA